MRLFGDHSTHGVVVAVWACRVSSGCVRLHSVVESWRLRRLCCAMRTWVARTQHHAHVVQRLKWRRLDTFRGRRYVECPTVYTFRRGGAS